MLGIQFSCLDHLALARTLKLFDAQLTKNHITQHNGRGAWRYNHQHTTTVRERHFTCARARQSCRQRPRLADSLVATTTVAVVAHRCSTTRVPALPSHSIFLVGIWAFGRDFLKAKRRYIATADITCTRYLFAQSPLPCQRHSICSFTHDLIARLTD
jgi:hypothetical protein